MKALLVAGATLIACAVPAPARASGLCEYNPKVRHASVYVVGDSITYHGRKLLPTSYEVNSKSFRPVSCLPHMLRARKGNHPWPTTVVMALGTNTSKGWSYADYRHAVDLFPKSTKVVLVTVYRDPRKHPHLAPVLKRYSVWMRELAKRDNVVVADWRAYISRHRSLLVDGTHPNKAGQKQWARIIVSAVN